MPPVKKLPPGELHAVQTLPGADDRGWVTADPAPVRIPSVVVQGVDELRMYASPQPIMQFKDAVSGVRHAEWKAWLRREQMFGRRKQ